MKKHPATTCPGCHRHCPLTAPRCKYGREYLAKQETTEKPAHKWEKLVAPGGLAWQLLLRSCQIKKALRGKATTEEALFGALSPTEQETLSALLNKLESSLCASSQK